MKNIIFYSPIAQIAIHVTQVRYTTKGASPIILNILEQIMFFFINLLCINNLRSFCEILLVIRKNIVYFNTQYLDQ